MLGIVVTMAARKGEKAGYWKQCMPALLVATVVASEIAPLFSNSPSITVEIQCGLGVSVAHQHVPG